MKRCGIWEEVTRVYECITTIINIHINVLTARLCRSTGRLALRLALNGCVRFASGTINENDAKTDAVGKSYVRGVKEHTASVPESGARKMITLEALVRGIEISRSRSSMPTGRFLEESTKRVKVTQQCYEDMIRLEKKPSGWKASTVKKVQSVQKQTLLNPGIFLEHGNQLYTTWYDIKKAFDSVNHVYLIKCIERLNMPQWISRFLKSIISRWSVTLKSNVEIIMEKEIEREFSKVIAFLCCCPSCAYGRVEPSAQYKVPKGGDSN
ncbi:unnamed protein product [Thelazia callipaeda]|uniref:Reverse transcriptase domain-containing protein n=1 Tax=Thelazia callipaeda TaxID=103827 RepID=A0A0N5D2S4_THECL|nr:unnamed protein product [Thelazia callipaeda]